LNTKVIHYPQTKIPDGLGVPRIACLRIPPYATSRNDAQEEQAAQHFQYPFLLHNLVLLLISTTKVMDYTETTMKGRGHMYEMEGKMYETLKYPRII